MELMEIREELFRQEYPQLLAGSDPDIERYCYLRGAGQGRAALEIYQLRLKPRYPDDALRMALLRSYRSKDPLYPRLLAVGYRRLAERALERVRQIIDYISAQIKACDPQDVYSTIKTIEEILRFFPREQYEAVSGLDRMYRYAQVLDRQVRPMEQAAEMVRSYLSQSLPVLEKERRRRRREQVQRAEASILPDFSTVVFSPEDMDRIEIPPRLTRVEDQTLAYCTKYWNLIDDAAFEQILFLYSRKYRKKNHSVYLTIRQGRRADHRDEDILTSVMSLLVTGYYYSIQGDRYLQQSWREIKYSVDRAAQPVPVVKPPAKTARAVKPGAPAAPSAPAKTAPVAKPVAPAKAAPAAKPVVPAKAVPAAKSAAPARAASVAKPAVPAKVAPAVKPVVPTKAAPAVKPVVPAKAVPAAKPVAPARAASVAKPAIPVKAVPAVKPVAPARTAPVVRPASPAKAAPVVKPAAPPVQAGGSVSDRLRKLSGRSYDLYQDRFLAHLRPAIRRILGAGRGIFFTPPEGAEDLVYAFLRDHYADPYMNWAASEERRRLAEQGFNLPSLNPVIDECFRKIK
jgi:hypothetical protein